MICRNLSSVARAARHRPVKTSNSPFQQRIPQDCGYNMLPRIRLMRALNRHVEPVFNPSRKDPHWERKRVRDRWPDRRRASSACSACATRSRNEITSDIFRRSIARENKRSRGFKSGTLFEPNLSPHWQLRRGVNDPSISIVPQGSISNRRRSERNRLLTLFRHGGCLSFCGWASRRPQKPPMMHG